MGAKAFAALLGTAALIATTGVAHATTAGDMIGYLNAQRAANGLPAGITENPQWSADCHQHNLYGKQNNTLEHGESPDKPGYSAAGDKIAKESALYDGSAWTAGSNPFEWAPIHLSQVIQPRIDVSGADESGGYGCITTFSSRNRPAPAADVVYTYPGDGTTIPYADEVAVEGPYAPGETLGLPRGTHTGPYLLAFPDGPGLDPYATASVTCAQLVGPNGAIDVLSTDNANPKLAGYLPPEVIVIPRNPLPANGTFAAAIAAVVTPVGGGQQRAFVHSWTFKTGSGGGPVPAASCPTPSVTSVPAGSTPGATKPSSGSGARKLAIAFPAASHPSVIVVGVEPAAVGRPATLRIRVVRRRCTTAAKKSCRYLLLGRRATTRSIKQLPASLKVAIPKHPKRSYVEVKLTIPTFRGADGTRYATTTVMRRYT